MNVEAMREYITAQYPGKASWAEKVRRMPDNQVIAIYFRAIEGNGLKAKMRQSQDETHRRRVTEKKITFRKEPEYEQLSLFDTMRLPSSR